MLKHQILISLPANTPDLLLNTDSLVEFTDVQTGDLALKLVLSRFLEEQNDWANLESQLMLLDQGAKQGVYQDRQVLIQSHSPLDDQGNVIGYILLLTFDVDRTDDVVIVASNTYGLFANARYTLSRLAVESFEEEVIQLTSVVEEMSDDLINFQDLNDEWEAAYQIQQKVLVESEKQVSSLKGSLAFASLTAFMSTLKG